MTDEKDYLRELAIRFRRLAGRVTDVSAELNEMANDVSARADQLASGTKGSAPTTSVPLEALAFSASPNGMMMIDQGGGIVKSNAEVERMFGYSREELIGRSVDMLLPERLRACHASQRGQFADWPEHREMGAGRELLGSRKDDSEFAVEVELTPIRTRDGPMVLAAVVDISNRKRLERLTDEFVSTVNHELRTPLTSISGSLALLASGAAGPLPERAGQLLRMAHRNSQRLVRLVNDVLDLQKMESGRMIFHLARVEVRTLVEQVVEANRSFAESMGISVRLEAPGPAEVCADPDRLFQVVTNLLSNAVKFSSPGGEVEVVVEATEDRVRLAVRDYGPGIPLEFRSRIFERFAQAERVDQGHRGGSGLGLSIVKQIVTRLEGEVGFEDALGGGTRFYVTLSRLAPLEANGRGLPDNMLGLGYPHTT